ncbi:MAG: phosphoribosylaminoimidazolesuccinocarboxamide synthase [bacterium]|nr:phosphoribosylaminoimidazolesuccinocarboxamide synthase [bacterium]
MKFSADYNSHRTAKSDIIKLVTSRVDNAFLGLDLPVPSYRGKVRDVYFNNNELLLVTTDRVSAFDVVLGAVPFKGAFLTEQAFFWLQKTREIIGNHLIDRLDDQVLRCHKAEPFKIELVVRGFLTGSLLREPKLTRGSDYGLKLDPEFKAHEAFPEPIVTPTTKADIGHDMPISLKEIVSSGLMSQKHLDAVVESALELFKLGSSFSKEQGLLLVDTKYEFGLLDGKVILIDEIHTADSSRYWIEATYQEQFRQNLPPQMLDKERLRSELIKQGYDGKNVSTLPVLTDSMKIDLSSHYWQLTETILGKTFTPSSIPASIRIAKCLLGALPQKSLQQHIGPN